MLHSVEALILFCRHLVQVESTSGREEAVASLIKEKMVELNFDEVWTDRAGNVIGKIKGNCRGKTLLFTGHMDTASIADRDAWTYDPFSAHYAEGRIYGLGICDMKAAIAAILYGLAELKAAHRGSSYGDIYVAFTVSELEAEGAAIQEVMEHIKPETVVLGEATSLNLSIGQRGRAEIEVISAGEAPATGKGEHASEDAVNQMMMFLERMLRLERRVHHDLGRGTSILTDVASISYPVQTTPLDHCRVTIDRRLLTGDIEPLVLEEYKQLHSGVSIKVREHIQRSYTGAVLRSRGFHPAWLLDMNHAVVQAAIRGLHQRGISAEITYYKGHTHGSYCRGIAGIPTIGFGPSTEVMARTTDEYVEIDQLIKAAEGYYALASTLAYSTLVS